MDDIEAVVDADPPKAIQLAESFKRRYGEDLGPKELARLEELSQRSLKALGESLDLAIKEQRWSDALAGVRSLAVLGRAPTGVSEASILLEEAKQELAKGTDTAAFLSAAESNSLNPLSGSDALLFLEKAVEGRQKRSAALFAAAATAAGVKIRDDWKAYIATPDKPADMINGVATVWVDRGIKVQNGTGTLDRVIGSAFFISRKGLLVTNYHVISSEVDPSYEGFSRLYIRMGDSSSTRIPAKVVGWDVDLDLAVIQAEVEGAYVFSTLDDARPVVGDQIIAIGSPASLEKTVTAGIVSAVSRRFLPLGDVLQIDAAVNQGNSGGPVVDPSGRLVGVAFAGIEQFEGLNFALNAQRLAKVLPALLRGGLVTHTWLGIALNQNRNGLEITYVAPDTPAREQDVREGLFVTALNGLKVRSDDPSMLVRLQDSLLGTREGELVSLSLSDGKDYVLSLAERPRQPLLKAAERERKERLTAPLFGFSLKGTGGGLFDTTYTVTRVFQGTIGEEAGLSENDPVSLRNLEIFKKEGYAVIQIAVKKRKMGFLESFVSLPAAFDSPDLL